MKTYHDISLTERNTFGLAAQARKLVVLQSPDDLDSLAAEPPFFVLGAGSNVLFNGRFEGTVLQLEERQEVHEGPGGLVTAWGGMLMDDLVQWAIAHGRYGLENLSAIPGTVGASAVQNVGAYGVEAKDVIDHVEAYDLQLRRHCTLTNAECQFDYRNSLFKRAGRRYVILRVAYRLGLEYRPVLTYSALASLPHATASQMRASITDMRWRKLPRPEEHGSAGSFFKNPVVDASVYDRLRRDCPDMPAAHAVEGGYKLSAGWLIDRCGWKGRTMGRAGVWPQQALVLYNTGGCTFDEVWALADAIRDDVHNKFGITLDAEAEIV